MRRIAWKPAGPWGTGVLALGSGVVTGMLAVRGELSPVTAAGIMALLGAAFAAVGLSARDRWPVQDLFVWTDTLARRRWTERLHRPLPASQAEIDAFLAEHVGDGHDTARVIMLAEAHRLAQARAELTELAAETPLQTWRIAYSRAFLDVLEDHAVDRAALDDALSKIDGAEDQRFARAQLGALVAAVAFSRGRDWLGTLRETAADVRPEMPRDRLLWTWGYRFYALDFFAAALGLGVLAGFARI